MAGRKYRSKSRKPHVVLTTRRLSDFFELTKPATHLNRRTTAQVVCADDDGRWCRD